MHHDRKQSGGEKKGGGGDDKTTIRQNRRNRSHVMETNLLKTCIIPIGERPVALLAIGGRRVGSGERPPPPPRGRGQHDRFRNLIIRRQYSRSFPVVATPRPSRGRRQNDRSRNRNMNSSKIVFPETSCGSPWFSLTSKDDISPSSNSSADGGWL